MAKKRKSGSKARAKRHSSAERGKSSGSGIPPSTAPIQPTQWKMPAGFRTDGQIASLKEVADPKIPTVSLGKVTPEQMAELTIKRIEQQPDFKISMVGAGVVDKDRAIAEVKAQSSVGRALTEIEQRVINNLVERATMAPTAKAARR